MAVIKSVAWKAGVFIQSSKNCMSNAKTLAYYDAEFNTLVKSLMIEANSTSGAPPG
jgi:hypothetical protein